MSKKPHLHYSTYAPAGSNSCCVGKNGNNLETFSILHPYSSGHKMPPDSFTLPPDQEALIHIRRTVFHPKIRQEKHTVTCLSLQSR